MFWVALVSPLQQLLIQMTRTAALLLQRDHRMLCEMVIKSEFVACQKELLTPQSTQRGLWILSRSSSLLLPEFPPILAQKICQRRSLYVRTVC
mmetsp:Transcript_35465/g.85468  ORF Transcript_35465/g.85468 Transcript_35465/m.85468 type:complete len:93 (-) Transcript_35465:112-390(-)